MKKCTKCGIEKDLSEFYKSKTCKLGVDSRCKCCIKIYDAIRNAIPENIAAKAARDAAWYAIPENRAIQAAREALPENIAKRKERYNAWYAEPENKIHIAKHNAEYNAMPEVKKKNNERHKERKRNNSLYRLECNIRCLIGISIKNGGYNKDTKTADILGCSFEEFKIYIENQFTEGMSWGNYPEWEYDHIIPISSAKSEEEIITLNHHTNFQPLWWRDNLKKGAKLPAEININNTITN
jgi:hypothetical protein